MRRIRKICLADTNARIIVAALLVVHGVILAWGAASQSPVPEEVAQLPAGISHLQFGRYDLYRVNPPLVRMLAALPVLTVGAETDWREFPSSPYARPEFLVGDRFIEANGERSFWLFTIARWACLPLSLIGGYVCYRWAYLLFGPPAGILATTLYCFCPYILGHGQLISTDLAAAALGTVACYSFWRWLSMPSWTLALRTGCLLGIAELTKTTWLVLFPLWPFCWLLWRLPQQRNVTSSSLRPELKQLVVILLLGILMINLAYGFEGSFKCLKDYKFISQTMCGPNPDSDGRNRFAQSPIGVMPVPFPENYVLGIDVQKRDFERPKRSYLHGHWRLGGWWYFYLYALAVKLPLGMLALVLQSVILHFCRSDYRTSWRNELLLLLPAAIVFTLVSSQTSFSHHSRYILPMIPFLIIAISRVGRAINSFDIFNSIFMVFCLGWTVVSSLWIVPHSLSYFNEIAGGPTRGHYHLINSDIDWGQDYLYLRSWVEKNPTARPLYIAYVGASQPRLDAFDFRTGRNLLTGDPQPDHVILECTPALRPGFYAISVNLLQSGDARFHQFLERTPIALAGYSIYIYRIDHHTAENR